MVYNGVMRKKVEQIVEELNKRKGKVKIVVRPPHYIPDEKAGDRDESVYRRRIERFVLAFPYTESRTSVRYEEDGNMVERVVDGSKDESEFAYIAAITVYNDYIPLCRFNLKDDGNDVNYVENRDGTLVVRDSTFQFPSVIVLEVTPIELV